MIVRKINKLIGLFKLTLSKIWIPSNQIKISNVNINDLELVVLVNEDVGRELVFTGSYEERDTKALKKLIIPTDVCIDVGANIGYYTTLLSKLAFNGCIHSFEPVPINWKILNLNIELNKQKNVVLNFNALADHLGRANFSVSKDGAYSSIKFTGRNIESETVIVDMDTLDNYILNNKLTKIDFIKIDVEGAEGLVLNGGGCLFDNLLLRPRLLVLELFDPNLEKFGTSVDALLSRMKGWGYAAKVADTEGNLISFDDSMKNRICNLFFTQ